jgi:predicted aspartyl protease
VAVSGGGYTHGISDVFETLIDTGAHFTSVDARVMRNILNEVRDTNGCELKPMGTLDIKGYVGESVKGLVYVIPNMWFGPLHLTDVEIVSVENSSCDCLLGMRVLHRFQMNFSPLENSLRLKYIGESSVKAFSEATQYMTEKTNIFGSDEEDTRY